MFVMCRGIKWGFLAVFFVSLSILPFLTFLWLCHGKRKCDLRDPGSLLKAHSSSTIEIGLAQCTYLPCCNHVKYEIGEWNHTIMPSLNIRLLLYWMKTRLIVYWMEILQLCRCNFLWKSIKSMVLCKAVLHEL